METSLLAKLKVNKPPAVKKDMEIRIKEKVKRDNVEKKDKSTEKRDAEYKDNGADNVMNNEKKIKKLAVQFVDETKNTDFDRATFLKTFQRPKIVNELTPPAPSIIKNVKEIEKEDNKTKSKPKPTTKKPVRTLKKKQSETKKKEDETNGEGEEVREKIIIMDDQSIDIDIDDISGIADKEKKQEQQAEQQAEQQQQAGGIIALEMGLGKTIVMLAVTFCNPKDQTLIVVPKSLLSQWISILKKITPTPSLLVYHNTHTCIKKITQTDLKKYQIVLTTYSHVSLPKKHQPVKGQPIMPRHIPFINKIKWDRVICDEAHHASHRSTSAYKGITLLMTHMMWMVTGTPIQNKKSEMVNLLNLITKKKPHTQNINIKQMVYYRTKENVSISMVPLHIHTIPVECKTNTEEELSRHIHSMVEYCNVSKKRIAIEEAMEDNDPRILTMKYFTLARQSCVYPPMLNKTIRRFETKLRELNVDSEYSCIEPNHLYTSESKVDSVISTIGNRIDNGCGKLILCYFHEEIDAIAKRLEVYKKRIVKFDGRSTRSERTTALTNPADILIGQIRMCSEGLNLQEHYSEVYFTSPHFNPAIEQQAIARCWRIGQKKEVNVFRFITNYKEKKSENASSYTMDTYSEKIQLKKKDTLHEFEEEAMQTPMAAAPQTPMAAAPQRAKIRRRLVLKKKKPLPHE